MSDIDWFNVPIIMGQPPCRCEICGEVKETRPYGPNDEEVCFPCGMRNLQAARRAFEKLFEAAS